MKVVRNWCTSQELAEHFNMTHEEMKIHLDVLGGKNFSVYHHTNEVKRITNEGLMMEYVVDYPMDIVVMLLEREWRDTV